MRACPEAAAFCARGDESLKCGGRYRVAQPPPHRPKTAILRAAGADSDPGGGGRGCLDVPPTGYTTRRTRNPTRGSSIAFEPSESLEKRAKASIRPRQFTGLLRVRLRTRRTLCTPHLLRVRHRTRRTLCTPHPARHQSQFAAEELRGNQGRHFRRTGANRISTAARYRSPGEFDRQDDPRSDCSDKDRSQEALSTWV